MRRKMQIRNIPWILSAVVFVGLVAIANVEGLVKAGVAMIFLAAMGILLPDLRAHVNPVNRKKDILALAVSALAGIQFYFMWMPSSMVAAIAGKLHLNKETFLAIAACMGGLLAVYSVRLGLYAAPPLLKKLAQRQAQKPCLHDAGYSIPKVSCIFLLVSAAVTITICSKSSPLYLLNDWVDANCYFTVGKSMLHGKVLYRDIFEHKGFYLYALHALGYLISNTTFFGVYLLEILAAFAFLLYAYKIALLFCPDADAIYILPVLAALVYGTAAFSHGDSAEEFCLPLLTYALWVGMKGLRTDSLPSRKECFFIGVTSGCVLWIKYTMLGFYLGWFVVPAFLMMRNRAWKELITVVAAIALGVGASTLPVLLYFTANGALPDLWQVYFYDNMFVYTNSVEVKRSVLENITRGLSISIQNNADSAVLILLGILWLYATEKRAALMQMLFGIIGTSALVFGGRIQAYYGFIFAAFVPFALPLLHGLLACTRQNWTIFAKRAISIGGG